MNVVPSVQHVDPENISGIVSHWKFNDGSGTSIANSINVSNPGVASGTVAFGTGKYNGAGVFNYNNTSTGKVLVKDPVLGSTAFTFSCWMNAIIHCMELRLSIMVPTKTLQSLFMQQTLLNCMLAM